MNLRISLNDAFVVLKRVLLVEKKIIRRFNWQSMMHVL